MNDLVKQLVEKGVLKTPRIIEAFRAIDRKDFVTDEYKDVAYEDTALPLTAEQTISQPSTVAFMLELLAPKPGQKVMDVGSGSGWTTALLAHIVSSGKIHTNENASAREKIGKVFAIERILELKAFGDKNISKYNFIKKGVVTTLHTSAEGGIPQEAPFDRILAGASAEKIPEAWKNQLAATGCIVMPIKNSIWRFIKNSDNSFEKEEHPGFVFVPFITRH